MKKLIILTVLWAGVLTNTNASVREKVEEKTTNRVLDVKPLKGLKFLVKIENIERNTMIEIKDASGNVFHSEFAYKNQPYVKVFDLSNLPDGEIFFYLHAGKEEIVKSFLIETEVKRSVSGK
jgi:hypothetical protein